MQTQLPHTGACTQAGSHSPGGPIDRTKPTSLDTKRYRKSAQSYDSATGPRLPPCLGLLLRISPVARAGRQP